MAWRAVLANSKAPLGSAVKRCSAHWRPVRAICASSSIPAARNWVETSIRSRNQIAQEMTSLAKRHPNDRGRGPPSCSASEKAIRTHGAIEHATADLRAAIETGAAASIGALVDTNEKLRTGDDRGDQSPRQSSAGLKGRLARRQRFRGGGAFAERRMDNFPLIFTNVARRDQSNSTDPLRAALDEASSLAETIARHKK